MAFDGVMNESNLPHTSPAIQFFEKRRALRDEFLNLHGFNNVPIKPVGEDGAFRRYFRLGQKGGGTVILMEAVPDGHMMATPGHRLTDFIRIGATLRANGLSTPHVYEVDEANGYVLMQDFGDVSFRRALVAGHRAEDIYGLATDVLLQLPHAGRGVRLPDYYQSHVHAGRRLIVDWYMPAALGRVMEDGIVDSYLAAWAKIENRLPPAPKGFLHIDFHVENLMLLDGQPGIQRCGILDFQGAMHGPLPYDLANLLEDARTDVSPVLRQAMLDRYCADMRPDDRVIFMAWYRVLATQFHCRVIGQFIRLAARDGKDRYLQFVPRLAAYIRSALKDPILHPFARWCAEQGLDFEKMSGFNMPDIKRQVMGDMP